MAVYFQSQDVQGGGGETVPEAPGGSGQRAQPGSDVRPLPFLGQAAPGHTWGHRRAAGSGPWSEQRPRGVEGRQSGKASWRRREEARAEPPGVRTWGQHLLSPAGVTGWSHRESEGGPGSGWASGPAGQGHASTCLSITGPWPPVPPTLDAEESGWGPTSRAELDQFVSLWRGLGAGLGGWGLGGLGLCVSFGDGPAVPGAGARQGRDPVNSAAQSCGAGSPRPRGAEQLWGAGPGSALGGGAVAPQGAGSARGVGLP